MNPCSISTCEDILIDILSRLPVKSLVRFTSVSRLWKSIITSPLFRLASNRPTRLLVHTKRECYTVVDHQGDNVAAHHELVFEANFPLRHLSYDKAVTIGSDNGLICIAIDHYSPCPWFVIWNPCIRKHVVVPDHPDGYSVWYSDGFGATTNGLDHKLVRIVGYTITVDENGATTQKAFHIHSLKSGTWRLFYLDYESYLKRSFCRFPALLRVRLHWVVSESGSNTNYISTLGLEDEVFVDYAMMLPEQISDSQFFFQDVTVVKESLAVVAMDVWKNCSLWVMQEYGDVGSWVKLCSVDQTTMAVGNFDLFQKNKVHVLDNGDLLLGFHEPGCPPKFVTCDPKTMKTNDFGCGTGVLLSPLGMCGFTNRYKESLVLLADEDRAVSDDKILMAMFDPSQLWQDEYGYYYVWTGFQWALLDPYLPCVY